MKLIKEKLGIVDVKQIDKNTICLFRFGANPIIVKVGHGYSKLYQAYKKRGGIVYKIDKKSDLKNVYYQVYDNNEKLNRLGKLNMLSAFGGISDEEETERISLTNTRHLFDT